MLRSRRDAKVEDALLLSATFAILGFGMCVLYWTAPQPSGPMMCYNCEMPKGPFGLFYIDGIFRNVGLCSLAIGVVGLALSAIWRARAKRAASEPPSSPDAASDSKGREE
jgi:hypothetical protein